MHLVTLSSTLSNQTVTQTILFTEIHRFTIEDSADIGSLLNATFNNPTSYPSCLPYLANPSCLRQLYVFLTSRRALSLVGFPAQCHHVQQLGVFWSLGDCLWRRCTNIKRLREG